MIAIFLIMATSLCLGNGNPTPPMPVGAAAPATGLVERSAVIDDNFRNQVYYVSSTICQINEMPEIGNLDKLDKTEKVIYTSLIILQTLEINDDMVKEMSNTLEGVQKLKISAEYYNKVASQWNQLVPLACQLQKNSSIESFNNFAKNAGSFSFKTGYLLLRTKLEPVEAFLKIAENAATKAGIGGEEFEEMMASKCEICFDALESSQDIWGFFVKEATPVVDMAFFEFSGYLGETFVPILFTFTSHAEYEINYTVLPKVREFLDKNDIVIGENL